MNIKNTFAVVSVIGAKLAFASVDCPISDPELIADHVYNNSNRDWREQVKLRQYYMDACPESGYVTYKEMDHYMPEYADKFKKMDLDDNNKVTMDEAMRY